MNQSLLTKNNGARRQALGSGPAGDREIGLLVLARIVIGLPLTLSGIRLVRNMLCGLSGTDPFSLAAAVGLLLFAGMASGYLPARRASRVDPVVALRDE